MGPWHYTSFDIAIFKSLNDIKPAFILVIHISDLIVGLNKSIF